MAIIKKNAEFQLKKRAIVPSSNGNGHYHSSVYLRLIIDFERKRYDIDQDHEEGVRFKKERNIQEDIAKASLVKEALLFTKKQLKL